MDRVTHLDYYTVLFEDEKSSPVEKGPPSIPATADSSEHEGAVEDQVVDVPAPAGRDYDDEPKQG